MMLEEMIAGATKIRNENVERFRQLPSRIADGEKIEPAEVLAIVEAAGLTLENLQADVSRLKFERSFQADADARPAADEAYKSATAEFGRIVAEYNAAIAKYEKLLHDAKLKQFAAQDAVRVCSEAITRIEQSQREGRAVWDKRLGVTQPKPWEIPHA